MDLFISPAGTVRTLYGETISLAELGPMQITRASHVDPDGLGQWWADLGPVNGPRLGPFRQRSEALAAETDWLQTQLLATSRD